LVECLKDSPVVGLDRHSFGGEGAMSVGRAEWAVRHTLVVQIRSDDDVVEDSCLTLERPARRLGSGAPRRC
jgi:hypothetical protein